MPGISSLSTAVSGLNAARTALSVIGHNMANVDTPGYTRQRIVQTEFIYQTIGNVRGTPQQVGLGTDYHGIQQIRDKFLDISYRQEVGKSGFYNIKASAGVELETILGELQSDYQTQTIITDLWKAINELSTYQSGLDTRGNFVSTCITFMNKANNVSERLADYQQNLNDQIKQTVQEINTLVEKVNNLNIIIKQVEQSGDRANDYRDQRNLALDQLSELAAVDIRFEKDGQVSLLLEGNELLANGSVNKLGLKYSAPDSNLVEPIFTSSLQILPYNAPATSYKTVYTLISDCNSDAGNDRGMLKALMVARGYGPCTYASPMDPDPNALDSKGQPLYPKGVNDPAYKLQQQKNYFDAHYSVIGKAQREFDKLVNSIVTMINDAVSPYVEAKDADGNVLKDADGNIIYEKDPDAPYDLSKNQSYLEVFVRNKVQRFDDNGNYIPEDPNDLLSLYSIGNISINPLLLDAGGYTLISLSENGDIENTSIVLDIMTRWHEAFISLDGEYPLSIDDYYRKFVTGIATETNESINYADEQDILVTQIDNKRSAVSGVSMDEEMENMLKYQHAYNAAARVVNEIDEMLERIMNLKR